MKIPVLSNLSLNKGNNALLIIFEGIAFTMVLNLYNPFVQMFAKRMGAEDIHIALLNSIPPLVAIFVLIPFGILIERGNQKKKTVLLLIFLSSLFYAAIAFVPFLPNRAKVITYILLIGVMNWPGSLYLATWQSFFADNFTGADATRVYSLRSKYGAFFGLLTVLLTGLVLTEIPKTEEERLVVYQLFYAACFIISLLQLYFLSRVQEKRTAAYNTDTDTEQKANNRLSFGRQDIRGILANRPFLIFCGCSFVFHLFWQMGWPIFFIYNVDFAKLNELQLGIMNVAGGLTQFLTFSLWNKFLVRKGSRFGIIFGALGLAINPFFYTRLFGFNYIIIINIFIGVASAGFALALFASLLETLPETNKTIYTSVFNTLINISGFVAPLIGIWIYSFLNVYSTMFVIGSLRVLAASTFILRWWLWRRQNRSVPGNQVTLDA